MQAEAVSLALGAEFHDMSQNAALLSFRIRVFGSIINFFEFSMFYILKIEMALYIAFQNSYRFAMAV